MSESRARRALVAARRGAAVLDEVGPADWRQSLADVLSHRQIRVSLPSDCVLYHTYGGFLEGARALGLHYDGDLESHGFACWPQDDGPMSDAWAAVVLPEGSQPTD